MLKKKNPKSKTKRRKLRRKKKKKKKTQHREGWLTHVEREVGERGGGAPPNCDGDSRLESWERWRDQERA